MPYWDKYSAGKQRAILRNRYWFAQVMAETECEGCHTQPPPEDWPIEWHHRVRAAHRHTAVTHLVKLGASIERILEEMEKCVPLCRRCHMKEDGRLHQMRDIHPRKKGVRYAPLLPQPCSICHRRKSAYRPGVCKQCKYGR